MSPVMLISLSATSVKVVAAVQSISALTRDIAILFAGNVPRSNKQVRKAKLVFDIAFVKTDPAGALSPSAMM